MGRRGLVVAVVLMMSAALPCSAAQDGTSDDRAAHSKAFVMLASTYVALNALDVYTTTKAIGIGAGIESNPLVGPAAANPVALTALKAASTATTIVLARQLWKKHRAAAIVLLVGANAGMSMIVMHNAGVVSR